MPYTASFTPETLTRADVDATTGPLILEFGANWCSICQGAQGVIQEAVDGYPEVTHVKVEDGPGRALGRSFKVKLWPTLVFLRDGQIHAQVVRPTEAQPLRDALNAIAKP